MNPETEKTVNQIADAVVSVVSAAASALGPAAPVVLLVTQSARGLLALAEHLGHGDAVRAALDAELAEARRLAREIRERKYAERAARSEDDTRETKVGP